MNIVLVPLIGPNSENWIAAEVVHASCLDNFFRLFLPPPASEIRAAAGAGTANAEPDDGELPSAADLAEMHYPNGFLVVDRDAALLERIKKFIKGYLLSIAAVQQVNEAPVLKYFLRLLHTKRVRTVIAQESVTVQDLTSSVTEGADIAQRLVQSLLGNCDAVIAFEPDNSQFQLRSMQCGSTPYSSLFLSCHVKLQQEALQRTWHWDRDADGHCYWLGMGSPDDPHRITRRNLRMMGAALAFESEIKLCDRYIGESLYGQVIREPGHEPRERTFRSAEDAYTRRWVKKWLASLTLILDAWRTSAVEVGNTQIRRLEIWTAMECDVLGDVGWHFIGETERFLSTVLEGEVVIKVCRTPSSGTREGRKAYEETHPRHLIASTRAIQFDRGFDVLFDPRFNVWDAPQVDDIRHTYTEVLTQELSVVRFVQERWSEKGLELLPRRANPPPE
jgi:hypothetical protein